MSSILMVCTGNVCRSPIAEGLLRDALLARLGDAAPDVASAGTSGWEGSPAMPESVEAVAERGCDISAHVARELTTDMIGEADLVIGMAGEHRDAVGDLCPDAASRTFTLKELGRLLESTPDGGPDLEARVRAAAASREAGFAGNPNDEDVADPLGMPIETYRAIAWELDGWISRVVAGLYGAEPAAAAGA
jgi:protein-tyrosine phosphatase